MRRGQINIIIILVVQIRILILESLMMREIIGILQDTKTINIIVLLLVVSVLIIIITMIIVLNSLIDIIPKMVIVGIRVQIIKAITSKIVIIIIRGKLVLDFHQSMRVVAGNMIREIMKVVGKMLAQEDLLFNRENLLIRVLMNKIFFQRKIYKKVS